VPLPIHDASKAGFMKQVSVFPLIQSVQNKRRSDQPFFKSQFRRGLNCFRQYFRYGRIRQIPIDLEDFLRRHGEFQLQSQMI
jgi:hypothetical protein